MKVPTHYFTHLWNDLSFEERKRMMPYMLENQLLHIYQCKEKAVAAHKSHMKVLDDWAANIERELKTYLED